MNQAIQENATEAAPVLEMRGISKRFGGGGSSLPVRLGLARPSPLVHALDNVDLTVRQGEFVGLVGESGSGKSTLGRVAAGLIEPSEGSIRVFGRTPKEARAGIHRDVQMIFQDPQASLNPRMRVGDAIGEAPLALGMVSRAEIRDYVAEQLRLVGLDPGVANRFPHQFSGGQRQRINIARALALKPRFLVCDESVASLDVSVQAQILNLFMELRKELDLTYLFISHDLRTVQHVCDRVAIMYLGRIVEYMPARAFEDNANHPYTRALLGAIPDIAERRKTFTAIEGEIPSPISPPSGCHFHPRCPYAFDRCTKEIPALRQVGAAHLSACHLNDKDEAMSVERPKQTQLVGD